MDEETEDGGNEVGEGMLGLRMGGQVLGTWWFGFGWLIVTVDVCCACFFVFVAFLFESYIPEISPYTLKKNIISKNESLSITSIVLQGLSVFSVVLV